MRFTEEQNEEFKKVCQPVIVWLKNNGHPHMQVIVNDRSAELVEGLMTTSVMRGVDHVLVRKE